MQDEEKIKANEKKINKMLRIFMLQKYHFSWCSRVQCVQYCPISLKPEPYQLVDGVFPFFGR